MTVERPEPESHELVSAWLPTPTVPASRPGGLWIPTTPRSVGTEARPRMTALPLWANVHVLVPLGAGQAREELLAQAEAGHSRADPLDDFDEPERDRLYGAAKVFVANHVRMVNTHRVLAATGRSFSGESLVVSERRIPRFGLRWARVNWAIDSGRVVDVTGHHVSVLRLSRVPAPPRRTLWAPGHGDRMGLAYFLANICVLLDLSLPEPLAAEGELSLQMNEFIDHGPTGEEREAAAYDGMTHFVFSRRAGLAPSTHSSVRYWPVADANEAAFSMFACAAHETAVPGLKQRWRVKMALSWISMLAILAAVCIGQFANFLAGYPKLLLAMWAASAALFVVSFYATHRFWRLDR